LPSPFDSSWFTFDNGDMARKLPCRVLHARTSNGKIVADPWLEFTWPPANQSLHRMVAESLGFGHHTVEKRRRG
jgi:hypothetical protein